MRGIWISIALLLATSVFAKTDLEQLYEKAYYLEHVNGQTNEALNIYREIAAVPATDENRSIVLRAINTLKQYYEFPHIIPFEVGFSEFERGDSIQITQVRSSTNCFVAGGTYLVRGTYTLKSRNSATLAFYLTTKKRISTRTKPTQKIHLKKGSGEFTLINTFKAEGWPHISLYPSGGGSGFGDVYFGSESWLKEKPFGQRTNRIGKRSELFDWQKAETNVAPNFDAFFFDSLEGSGQERSKRAREIFKNFAGKAYSKESKLQQVVLGFDMRNAGLDSLLAVFGEPKGYYYGKERYEKSDLPSAYNMVYPNGFSVYMVLDELKEFRFEKSGVNQVSFEIGGVHLGAPLETVIKTLGEPRRTVDGRECSFEEGVLFRESKGWPAGHAYYATKGLRLFFMYDKLIGLYVEDNTILGEE